MRLFEVDPILKKILHTKFNVKPKIKGKSIK